MAEIDKGLPNTRTKLDIPSEEEIAEDVAVQEQEPEKGPIEVIPEEDGGVTLDYEPGSINVPGTESHFDNLAELLPDDVLEPIGNDMVQNYMDYKASRKDWEQSYTTGLDLLGFKYDMRTEPFQGASGATHPVLAEAVTQFQALAYKELLPANGPVRTQVVGAPSQEKAQQAEVLTSAVETEESTEVEISEAVEHPAKVMRVGTMMKQLLEEVRSATLDEASRGRLKEIFDTSVEEIGSTLTEDLREELDRLVIPFDDEAPTAAELQIAHAQLVGWLEGLVQGIQATLFAQQMAAQQQLADMRRGEIGPAKSPSGDQHGNYL